VTFEVALMLALLVGALVLFALEILPIEVTALLVLAALILSGAVTLDEALSGFSNKAVVTIGCLFVLSHALTKTGLVALAAERVAAWAERRYWLGVGSLLAAVALLSGFLNNTAVVAIFIPLMLHLCASLGISPSKVLIPLSYASIFGGTLTLIGTSTNLLVSSIAQEAGQPAFGMFEFAPVGAIFLALGLGYTLFFSRRLLPARVEAGDPTATYGLGAYLSEVRVDDESPLAGKTGREVGLGERYGINVLGVIRGGLRLAASPGSVVLQKSDVLIVQAHVDDLMRLRRELGVSLLPEVKLSQEELTANGLVTAEMLVAPASSLVGRTLKQSDFRSRFGGFVMAIRRHSETLRAKIAHTVLQPWDALLTLIPRARLEEIRRSRELVVLTELPVKLRRHRLWWLVLLVLPLAVLLAATGVLEIAAGSLLAAVALLVFRVVSPREAYDAIHWQVIFLIAAFVPVGHAAIATGTADFIAAGLLSVAELLPVARPYAVLALLYLATSLLTQVVSNAAAAIILAPVALSLAAGLGVEPRAFLMAVCFAASAEFMTPVGYQTNLMVYAPGGYRFLDYTRFGAPLNLAFWLTATFVLPIIWPF
jgi:di/tricarboxylate transporter